MHGLQWKLVSGGYRTRIHCCHEGLCGSGKTSLIYIYFRFTDDGHAVVGHALFSVYKSVEVCYNVLDYLCTVVS